MPVITRHLFLLLCWCPVSTALTCTYGSVDGACTSSHCKDNIDCPCLNSYTGFQLILQNHIQTVHSYTSRSCNTSTSLPALDNDWRFCFYALLSSGSRGFKRCRNSIIIIFFFFGLVTNWARRIKFSISTSHLSYFLTLHLPHLPVILFLVLFSHFTFATPARDLISSFLIISIIFIGAR